MQNMSVDIAQSTALWVGGFSGCEGWNDSAAMTLCQGLLLSGKTHSLFGSFPASRTVCVGSVATPCLSCTFCRVQHARRHQPVVGKQRRRCDYVCNSFAQLLWGLGLSQAHIQPLPDKCKLENTAAGVWASDKVPRCFQMFSVKTGTEGVRRAYSLRTHVLSQAHLNSFTRESGTKIACTERVCSAGSQWR